MAPHRFEDALRQQARRQCISSLPNERFNGTLRREVLNAEWFATTAQAQIVINQWLRQYNHVRPHEALSMRAPVPETIQRTTN